MFLVNKLTKMKHGTRLGTRIAEVHNGSSLFTGDAAQGESNIRRWIIENDWLEGIIALPENMFYNSGIATYIWVLTNRKREERRGKVQLIDADEWFVPLRRNLGKKNCEFSTAHIRDICDLVVNPIETKKSKLFPNEAFGYWKVTLERPLHLAVDLNPVRLEGFEHACTKAKEEPHFNVTREDAAPVLKKIYKPGKAKPDPIHGLFEAEVNGKPCVVEYEPDTALRDSEQIPLLENGGIEAFFRREVLPYTPDLPAPRLRHGRLCVYVLKCSDDSFISGKLRVFRGVLNDMKMEK